MEVLFEGQLFRLEKIIISLSTSKFYHSIISADNNHTNLNGLIDIPVS